MALYIIVINFNEGEKKIVDLNFYRGIYVTAMLILV